MSALEKVKEEALEEANSTRKRAATKLTGKEKRGAVAGVLNRDLSEENCVLFLGM